MTEADAEYTIAFAREVMPRYIESARQYAQLAIGALALSVVFREKVLGEQGRMRPNVLLVLSWVSFLISIAASALYQYVAVKFIAYLYDYVAYNEEADYPKLLNLLGPAPAYTVMIVSFFLGAALLVAAATLQLLGSRDATPAARR